MRHSVPDSRALARLRVVSKALREAAPRLEPDAPDAVAVALVHQVADALRTHEAGGMSRDRAHDLGQMLQRAVAVLRPDDPAPRPVAELHLRPPQDVQICGVTVPLPAAMVDKLRAGEIGPMPMHEIDNTGDCLPECPACPVPRTSFTTRADGDTAWRAKRGLPPDAVVPYCAACTTRIEGFVRETPNGYRCERCPD